MKRQGRRSYLFLFCGFIVISCAQEAFAVVDPEKIFNDSRVVALARAVAAGDITQCQRLLASEVDVKAKGASGMTLPHFALYAKSNGPAVLRALLKGGADPISRLENGEDLPHYAASRDNADPEFLAVLLDAGVSANFIGGAEDNSLLDAAVSGRNIPVVQLLIARGANVNYNDPFVGTALHTAVVIPDYRIATILLEHGADPNLKDNQDPTIAPSVPRLTPAEKYCRFLSGKRTHPFPERLSQFEAMKAAFAKRGVTFPCGI